MPKLLEFLGGPLIRAFKTIGDVADRLHTTDEERAAIHKQLAIVAGDIEVKLAEYDTQFAAMQRDAIVAEANGHSWLQRNWRPLMMLFFASLIGVVIWTGGYINGHQVDAAFIMEILGIIKLGIGGYVVGRSVEKVAPSIVKAFSAQK